MGEGLAVQRLEAARAEQARLKDACARAAGSPEERMANMRLCASDLSVAVRDRTLRFVRQPPGPEV